MSTSNQLLQVAIDEVENERSAVYGERRAFEEFLETVRLTSPVRNAARGRNTAEIRNAYQRTVMATANYDVEYGNSLEESLEQELSPRIAARLLSNEPFTQQTKRDLLVRTADSIERRNQLLTELSKELDFLTSTIKIIDNLRLQVDALPACCPRQHSLDQLLDIWEAYEDLAAQCQSLLEERQDHLEQTERAFQIYGENHALYTYLYGALDTQYPVLRSIASTNALIRENQQCSETVHRPIPG